MSFMVFSFVNLLNRFKEREKEMRKFLIISVTMLCVGLSTMAAQGALVHYTFNETSVGNWEVFVGVTDTASETAGLSAYSVWVVDVAAGTCSWTQNALSVADSLTSPPYFQSVGFLDASSSDTVYPSTTTPSFNAGSYQNAGDTAITGIGEIAVNRTGTLAGTVTLGVPAKMGTLTTPAGLGEANFSAFSSGLLNADNTDYVSPMVVPTFEVNPIPEPATLAVLGLGVLSFLVARRRR